MMPTGETSVPAHTQAGCGCPLCRGGRHCPNCGAWIPARAEHTCNGLTYTPARVA